MDFRRPMLNSPVLGDSAAADAFFRNVKRRMNWTDDFRDDSDESVSHVPPTSDPSQMPLLLAVHRIFIDLAARGLVSGGIANVMPPSLAVRLAEENITARKRSKSTRGFSV